MSDTRALPLGLVLLLGLGAMGASAQTFDEGRGAYLHRDYAQALRIWSVLAKAGDARAEFGLGVLYHEGAGAPRDPEQAAAWFRRAAEQSYAPAQFNLGNAYRRGEGVEQSDAAANEWWKLAADQEFAPAQYNLATQYAFGRGVPRDEGIAMIYYRRAGENGHPGAYEALRRLEAREGAPPAAAYPSASEASPRSPHPSGPARMPGAAPHGVTALATSAPRDSGASWIRAQDPRWFTAQIASVATEDAAKALIGEHTWPQPVGYMAVTRGGKRLYSVLYGAFPDRRSAEQAARALPPSARAGGTPWVRGLRSVQAELSR